MITKEQKLKIVDLSSDMTAAYAHYRISSDSEELWNDYLETTIVFADYLDTITKEK